MEGKLTHQNESHEAQEVQPHRTRATDTFPLSSNRYNALCNVLEVDDTPVSTGISRSLGSKQVRMRKLDRKRMVGKKQRKFIILVDSHGRECASEVSYLLNNDFEVLRFVNPGAGMKYIKRHVQGEASTVNKERRSGAMGREL